MLRCNLNEKRIGRNVAVCLILVLAAACTSGTTRKLKTSTVRTELNEFSISSSVASTEAGKATFDAKNTGTLVHELVVLKTAYAPNKLPSDGGVATAFHPGIEVVGSLPPFAAGATLSKDLFLVRGNYVLICNVQGHYQAGMRKKFIVK